MPKMWSLCTLVSFSLFLALSNAETPSRDSTPLRDMNIDIPEGHYHQIIHQFHKTKPDVVRFELSGQKEGIFNLTSHTGALYLHGTLDRERKASYALTIQAFNQNNALVEGPFSINVIVEDINDNAPAFNQSTYTTTVRERSKPGRTFFTVCATDPDDPRTPNAQLFYSIFRQIPNSGSARFFEINNATGEISTTVEGYHQLDPLTNKEFELLVEVADGAGLSETVLTASAKVFVSVTESLWKAPAAVYIKENLTEKYPIKITQVRCNELNAKYVLLQKERFLWFPFSIDDQGDIYVTEPLDREIKSLYVFSALAKDENGNWLERPVEVVVHVADINDNPPVCEKALTHFEVQENEGIGSTIGTLIASDLDQDSVLSYKLLDQVPKVPADAMFTINEFSAIVRLIKEPLDRKRVSRYDLTVEVSDAARPPEPVFKTICRIQIRVIDVNKHAPQFVSFDYGNLNFPEDTPLGTVILQIKATDEDEPFTGISAIVYEVTEGDPNGTFSIVTDPRTGIGYVKIFKPLDFETFSEYNILVQARNPEPLLKGMGYGANSTTRFRVTVTDVDEPPIFNQTIYQMSIPEDAPIGAKVGTVLAYDPEGRAIRYSISEDKRQWLKIDSRTGEIFTAAQLDRETQEAYFVRVLATEAGKSSMESSVPLFLTLGDVNDNAPELTTAQPAASFCYPLTRKETVVLGAKDLDTFRNGPRFTFSFVDQKTLQNWTMNSINWTHASLVMKHTDFEIRDHNIPIKIKDRGNPPMERQTTVQVRICECTAAHVCVKSEVEKGPDSKFPTVGMAVGILVSVLAFIGIVIGAVFISLHCTKKKEKKAVAADAKNQTETQNLAL